MIERLVDIDFLLTATVVVTILIAALLVAAFSAKSSRRKCRSNHNGGRQLTHPLKEVGFCSLHCL